jgi:Tfp pilus assembly protein PilV
MSQNRSRRRRRIAVILAAAAALAFAAYAFTASNTVPTSKAGDGNNTISGYAVTNVAYVLASNPATIDKVTFTLDAAAGTVKAKVVSSSSTYADCSNTGGTNWSCDFATDPTVLSADELRVIAVQ